MYHKTSSLSQQFSRANEGFLHSQHLRGIQNKKRIAKQDLIPPFNSSHAPQRRHFSRQTLTTNSMSDNAVLGLLLVGCGIFVMAVLACAILIAASQARPESCKWKFLSWQIPWFDAWFACSWSSALLHAQANSLAKPPPCNSLNMMLKPRRLESA